jgi:hypothetical protein
MVCLALTPPEVLSAYVAEEAAYFTLVLLHSGELFFRLARVALIGAAYVGAFGCTKAVVDAVMVIPIWCMEAVKLKKEHAALKQENLALKLAGLKNFKREKVLDNLIKSCQDPITLAFYRNPVILQCGHIISNASMEELLKRTHPRCPICMQELIESRSNPAVRFVNEITQTVQEMV